MAIRSLFSGRRAWQHAAPVLSDTIGTANGRLTVGWSANAPNIARPADLPCRLCDPHGFHQHGSNQMRMSAYRFGSRPYRWVLFDDVIVFITILIEFTLRRIPHRHWREV